VHSWQIQLTVPMGRAADEPDVLLQPYDLLKVFPLLGSLAERAKELGVRVWPGNNLGYFGPHERALRGTLPKGHLASCGAGRAILGIEADGSIKGCPSLPTEAWTGGNIRDNSLRDIWERSAPLRYTRDRTVEDLWGFCRTCYYADECRAGCTWTSFVFFGRPGNNPLCHHRALEMQRAGKRRRGSGGRLSRHRRRNLRSADGRLSRHWRRIGLRRATRDRWRSEHGRRQWRSDLRGAAFDGRRCERWRQCGKGRSPGDRRLTDGRSRRGGWRSRRLRRCLRRTAVRWRSGSD
jgi:radical SAM protein with 4Fe4S-binding SPASM domain